MEKKTAEELNQLFNTAEEADKKIFAEMRSNILLNTGKHYERVQKNLEHGLRNRNVNKETRIRLTKNHTKVLCSNVQDVLLNQASDFVPIPKNESEIQDQKSAEIAKAVWLQGKEDNDWNDYLQRTVHSFVVTGETATKVSYDPTVGKLTGYEPKLNEEGMPLYYYQEGATTSSMDENGIELEQILDETKPIFNGKICIERLSAYNLMRDPNAKTMKESPYVIIRKMVPTAKLVRMFANTGDVKADTQMKEKIKETSDKTYKIFDSNSAKFVEAKGMATVREFYYRQSVEHPKGYIYICIENEILYDAEIPLGEEGEIAFPIKHTGYDLIDDCPRYSSLIRDIRPEQAEINRAASKIAETQVTVGDDKVFIPGAGKLEKGASLPGIRVIKTGGGRPPVVVQGRSGDQFTGYLKDNVQEMYQKIGFELNLSNAAQSQDMDFELFKSAKLKQKFSRQALRLENYFKSIVNCYLFLASKYKSYEDIVVAAGKNEAFNIDEFKSYTPLNHLISVQPVDGDFYTMFGKNKELTTISQYFGKDMDKYTQAAVIKSMPFLNKDPVIKDLLQEYEAPMNMLLALDRGDEYVPSRYDDSKNMLKRLHSRVREPSFKLLDPTIQESYEAVIGAYEGIESEQTSEALRLQKGMIPTGGSLVKCDLYVNKPNTRGGVKTERATVSSQALEWLISAMEKQGLAQERLIEIDSVQSAINIGEEALSQGRPDPSTQETIPPTF